MGIPAFTAEFSLALDPLDPGPNDGSGIIDPNDGTAAPMAGGTETFSGRDVNPLEAEGVFTALLRLERALLVNDVLEVQRSIDLLDQRAVKLNFSRAELGARQQGLDIMGRRLQSEEVDLKTVLSEEFDVDLVEAISDYQGRQVAFEAALRAASSIFQLTLLNFL